ncbi:outer membrane lipoprotein [Hydrogenothermus marinus]|uniref:Outer membrane lipoprotein SlyB n=1 Tax=Hydrogenothermus marinus TaxID=133270 RepID=A0A3M0BI94_9AQUI|nr:glycine zipper 2TM domain-containing protein [Hydrogenothermus marinus]RMA97143.1 outer membrane lipoprotein SlyB [Hydrogenothermus marinus]
MKKIIIFLQIIAIGILSFSCTRMYNSNEVSVYDTNTVLTYEEGVVEDIKPVIIKDDGSGTFIGAAIGAVLGSFIGEGKATSLSTLLGGLVGAYAGNQLDKANAEELFIKLDNSRKIVVIVKGVNIQKGDRVRIIKEGNKIVRVERIT